MDEETLRKEFYSWFENVFVPRLQNEVSVLPHECPAEAWLESARRADKRVINLLQNDAFAMSFQSLGQYRSAVIKAIRATITEEAT